jgi:hypothetical protein
LHASLTRQFVAKSLYVISGLLPLKSNKYYIFWVCVCVCSLGHPTWKAHALCYIVIFGLSGCTTIFHFIFGKKLLNVNVCFYFWFSPQLLSETFLILGRTVRDIINVHRSLCKVPVVLVIF